LTSHKKIQSNKLGFVVLNNAKDHLDEFDEASSSKSSESEVDVHGDTDKFKFRLIADGIKSLDR